MLSEAPITPSIERFRIKSFGQGKQTQGQNNTNEHAGPEFKTNAGHEPSNRKIKPGHRGYADENL